MTIVYLTSGLPVQDTSTLEPSATTAYLTSGLPASELPLSGYTLYAAKGGLSAIDFSDAKAVYPAGSSTGDLTGYDHDDGTHTLVLRPSVDGLETPDISAQTEFTLSGGEWTGYRPDPVQNLGRIAKAGGVIELSWYHRIFDGATPTDFEINYGTTPSATGTSVVVSYSGNKTYKHSITLVDGTTYWFSVVARTSGLDSERKTTLSITADASAPASPTITVGTTWQPLQ